MTPEAIRAKEAIYKFDYAKRQCYLESDRDLHFYRHYSFLNCYMECSSNVTFQVGNIDDLGYRVNTASPGRLIA